MRISRAGQVQLLGDVQSKAGLRNHQVLWWGLLPDFGGWCWIPEAGMNSSEAAAVETLASQILCLGDGSTSTGRKINPPHSPTSHQIQAPKKSINISSWGFLPSWSPRGMGQAQAQAADARSCVCCQSSRKGRGRGRTLVFSLLELLGSFDWVKPKPQK